MRRRFLAHGREARSRDGRPGGVRVLGGERRIWTAAANVALGAVFNIPPPGFVSLPSFPFTYPLAARVEAGSTFIVACAAAFALRGVLPFTPARIGAQR